MSKDKTSKESINSALRKTDVICSDFRIVEYKDHFRIQKKKHINHDWYYLNFIPIWRKKPYTKWVTILKDGSEINIRNCVFIDEFQFKTKDECILIINDFLEFPKYHYI